MQFLLLMVDEPGAYDDGSADERRALLEEYGRLSDELVTAGAYVAAGPLEPAASTRTVRVENGEVRVAAGAAVDSPATLGGYYLIEVASQADAVAWAARIPAARFGRVEVHAVRTPPPP